MYQLFSLVSQAQGSVRQNNKNKPITTDEVTRDSTEYPSTGEIFSEFAEVLHKGRCFSTCTTFGIGCLKTTTEPTCYT